jgi:acyl carrier protein
MDKKEILYILSEIFEEIKDDPIDTSGITCETSLRDDLEIDSLQTAEMLVEIEERLGVTIMDEEAPRLRTVGDVVELILQKNPKRRTED